MSLKKSSDEKKANDELVADHVQEGAVVPTEVRVSSVDALVSHDVVERSIHFINEIYNRSAHNASKSIAQHVIKTYFDDDINSARSRNPRKKTSYRALCEHPDLSISLTTLAGMIAVECQELFLRQQGVDPEKISFSHQVELARLPDGRDKVKLARDVVQTGLNVRSLRGLVQQTKDRIGRPERLIPDLKGPYRDNPFLLLGNTQRMGFVLDKDKLKKLSPQARKQLQEEVEATQRTLEDSLSQVASILGNLKELNAEDQSTEAEG